MRAAGLTATFSLPLKVELREMRCTKRASDTRMGVHRVYATLTGYRAQQLHIAAAGTCATDAEDAARRW
jgi:hypothetical protein